MKDGVSGDEGSVLDCRRETRRVEILRCDTGIHLFFLLQGFLGSCGVGVINGGITRVRSVLSSSLRTSDLSSVGNDLKGTSLVSSHSLSVSDVEDPPSISPRVWYTSFSLS